MFFTPTDVNRYPKTLLYKKNMGSLKANGADPK